MSLEIVFQPNGFYPTFGSTLFTQFNFQSGSTRSSTKRTYKNQFVRCKVNVSIPIPDPYPCPTIAPISDSFSPICAHACFYSQGCNQCKCMTWLNVTSHYSLHGNGCNLQTQIAIYNDLLCILSSICLYFCGM
jgi:hypothetical protein